MKNYEIITYIILLITFSIIICMILINPIISGYMMIGLIFIILTLYLSNIYYKRYKLQKNLLNIEPVPIQVPHIIIEGDRYYIGIPFNRR